MSSPAPRLDGKRRLWSASAWTQILAAVFYTGFFLRFCAVALGFPFGSDELMNINTYWEPGVWKLISANLTFWSTFNRPMGAVYYMPAFTIFGLNPAPFTVIRLAILLISAGIFYRLATRISGSRSIAAVAALPLVYHAGMSNLVYEGSYIYDLLCGLFFFAAMLYYIRARETHGRLGLRRTAVFLVLYICALNSKEMAVSLPVLVVAFELLRRRPSLTDLAPALAAVLVTVVFIAGKILGADSLVNMEAYRPVFTWARFSESTARFLNTIFYSQGFTAGAAISLWLALICAAIFYRDRRLALAAIWVAVTPLPIAFIPARYGGCLYIVAAGWALVVAICAAAAVRRIERIPGLAWMPRGFLPAVTLVLTLALYVRETAYRNQSIEAAYRNNSGETVALIEQFRALPVRPLHGSTVLFLNDPVPNGFDTQFAANLTWKDRSIAIWLQKSAQFSASQIAGMDYVFDFPGGKLTLIKSPPPLSPVI